MTDMGQAIIESNARQSAFYAVNDPSIPAGPECGIDYDHPETDVDDDGIPYCMECLNDL